MTLRKEAIVGNKMKFDIKWVVGPVFYDPGGSRPRLVILACLFSLPCFRNLSLSLQQVIGDRFVLDWLGYKSPDQPAVEAALVLPAFGFWFSVARWIFVDLRRRLFCYTPRLTLLYIFGYYS